MWFNHLVTASYARPISGHWNEPETHIFLNHVIDYLDGGSVGFVDVGANTGEMVIDVSRHEKVKKIIAFEPISTCADTIRKSLDLNNYEPYVVIEKAVDETAGMVSFAVDMKNTSGSSVQTIAHIPDAHAQHVSVTTLNIEMSSHALNVQYPILLIDVEGYEPAVLRGGRGFIEQFHPLIIFEYNHVSKQHYELSAIKEILGAKYRIFRVRQDGRLDKHTDNAWNCVAVPTASRYSDICGALLVKEEK